MVDSTRNQTVTRLRSNLVKLKDHLESLQKKGRSKTPASKSPRLTDDSYSTNSPQSSDSREVKVIESKAITSEREKQHSPQAKKALKVEGEYLVSPPGELEAYDKTPEAEKGFDPKTDIVEGLDPPKIKSFFSARHSLPEVTLETASLLNKSYTYSDLSRAGVYVPKPFPVNHISKYPTNFAQELFSKSTENLLRENDLACEQETAQAQSGNMSMIIRPEAIRPMQFKKSGMGKSRHDVIEDDIINEDSADESDIMSSNRGTNDSAYASDRATYSSITPHTLYGVSAASRRASFDESNKSSPG